MTTRLTLDLDFKNKNRLIYFTCKAIRKIPKILLLQIKPSNSKGFHMIIWTKKNYTLKQQYKLREILGDDKTRIRLDKLRKIGRNTLFYKKEFFKKNGKSK